LRRVDRPPIAGVDRLPIVSWTRNVVGQCRRSIPV
jgi:hypothetical protein